jgi:hypothetical protein
MLTPAHAFAALLAGLTILARPLPAVEPEAVEDALAWFEQLGFPNVKDCPYVRVELQDPGTMENGLPRVRTDDGFLLSDSDGEFEVFFGGSVQRGPGFWIGQPLRVVTFKKGKQGTKALDVADYTRLDLKAEARKSVEALRLFDDRETFSTVNFLAPRAAAFVLARNCRQNGLNGAAEDLLAEACKLKMAPKTRAPNEIPFQTVLARHMGEVLIGRAVLDFEDPETSYRGWGGIRGPVMSRAELVSVFGKLAKNFPRNGLDNTVRILQRMTVEDAAHQPKSIGQMSESGQIEEWIFRLRDQPGWTFSTKSSCEIFSHAWLLHPPDKVPLKYPADHLRHFGFAAVPQLIDALDDDRFCRAIEEGRRSYRPQKVLTIGDCARQILEAIAHRNFRADLSTGKKSIAEENRETGKMIRDWWTEVQSKGEAAVLVEGVRMGNWSSMAQGRRLLEAYPGVAAEAIMAGVRSAKDGLVRNYLVQLLSGAKDDGSGKFLRETMTGAPSLDMRLAAARALLQRGSDDALPAMIAEWKRITSDSSVKSEDIQRSLSDLGHFLAWSGRPDAIEALAAGLPMCPVRTRLDVINDFDFKKFVAARRPHLSISDATISDGLVEALLILALDDRERRKGFSMSSDAHNISDPKICDMAAMKLAERWPEKYAFKWSGAPDGNEKQIAVIKVIAKRTADDEGR